MVRFGGAAKPRNMCARCGFSIVDQPQFEKDGKVYCKTCYTIISTPPYSRRDMVEVSYGLESLITYLKGQVNQVIVTHVVDSIMSVKLSMYTGVRPGPRRDDNVFHVSSSDTSKTDEYIQSELTKLSSDLYTGKRYWIRYSGSWQQNGKVFDLYQVEIEIRE